MRRSLRRCMAMLLVVVLNLSACGDAKKPNNDVVTDSETMTWQEQYDLGVRYLADGNYSDAIIAFTSAIEIDPKQPDAFIRRADAYLASDVAEETVSLALADYEAALALDDSAVDAYLGLAEVYIRQGDNNKAIEILTNALKMVGDILPIQEKLDELNSSDSSGDKPESYSRRSELVEGRYAIYEYDAESDSAIERHYEADGTAIGYFVFRCDNGRAMDVTSYDEAGTQTGYVSLSYNDAGNRINDYWFGTHFEIVRLSIHEYDAEGQKLKTTYYESDGTVAYYGVVEEDSNGKKQEIVYMPDGTRRGSRG